MTTVLYVDDSHLGRTLARMNLTSAGHTIIEASDGVAALAAAMSHHPDCLLLCSPLPALDALDLLKRLREAQVRSRVIILASHPRKETVDAFHRLGVAAILERHDSSTSLADAVARALSGASRAAA